MVLPMQTRLSSKGQVVLPAALRRRLGLMPGDEFDARVKQGEIVITPRRAQTAKPSIQTDPATGFPVLVAGANLPRLTSEDVAEILANLS